MVTRCAAAQNVLSGEATKGVGQCRCGWFPCVCVPLVFAVEGHQESMLVSLLVVSSCVFPVKTQVRSMNLAQEPFGGRWCRFNNDKLFLTSGKVIGAGERKIGEHNCMLACMLACLLASQGPRFYWARAGSVELGLQEGVRRHIKARVHCEVHMQRDAVWWCEAWRFREEVLPCFSERDHFGVQAHQTHAVQFFKFGASKRECSFASGREFLPVRPRVLRARERPECFGSEETEIPILSAKRTAALAQLMWLAGAHFSIDNTLKSILWELEVVPEVGQAGRREVRRGRHVTVRWYAHGADWHPHQLRVDSGDIMQPGGTTQARAAPGQGLRLQAERHGSIHLTRQRAPTAVVHDSNLGLQGRFGEGFDLQRGAGDEAESLGGFYRVFLQGTRTDQDHGRSVRKPTPPPLGDSRTPTTQLLVPGLFAKQGCVHVVSSSRLQRTKSPNRRS